MTLRCFGRLMLLLTVSPASLVAEERVVAPQSAAEFVIEFVVSLPRIHQAACASAGPNVKAEFDSAIEGFRVKVDTSAQSLLASGVFVALKSEPVSQGIRSVYHAEYENLKERYANIDVLRECPLFLKNIRDADAELVEAGLAQAFAAMRSNIAAEKHGLLK